jgi:hypothetical protein
LQKPAKTCKKEKPIQADAFLRLGIWKLTKQTLGICGIMRNYAELCGTENRPDMIFDLRFQKISLGSDLLRFGQI